jgi:predicted lactoylglutathione lyase
MHQQIYVNLPVKSIERTKAFFASLGFSFNPQFSNENALCMVIGENIYAMLLAEPFFKTFTKKPIADATKSTEVLVCISCDNRGQVDDLVAKALSAGGSAPNPKQDLGFMYSHGFEDPDGHVWELVYMDPNATPPHA